MDMDYCRKTHKSLSHCHFSFIDSRYSILFSVRAIEFIATSAKVR
jgi:hypothetical protein